MPIDPLSGYWVIYAGVDFTKIIELRLLEITEIVNQKTPTYLLLRVE
jgi:hypothetical protein